MVSLMLVLAAKALRAITNKLVTVHSEIIHPLWIAE